MHCRAYLTRLTATTTTKTSRKVEWKADNDETCTRRSHDRLVGQCNKSMNTLLEEEYIHICNAIWSRIRACNLHLWRGSSEVTVCNGIGTGDDNVDDPDAIVLRKR